MDLNGQNVVVTGASGGIGEKIAERFAAAGANVLGVARSEDKLAALADRIGAQYLVADLASADGVDGLIERCIEVMGRVDVLVNNAGVETDNAFVAVDRSDLRMLARLNYEAPMMLTRDVLPHMIKQGSGHIVQMSSVAGAIPFPGLAAYAGTKAGLTHLTETLRIELQGTGIGLTVVSPGPVDTPMWDRLDNEDVSFPAPALKRFAQLQFLPKLTPDKVAEATVAGVQKNKRFIRLPYRYTGYHMLNNAPRRLVEGALLGVNLPLPEPADDREWTPIWPTDNPTSRRWPLYTRGNVGEVFPEVVLPLTWDVIGQAAEDGWRGAFAEMGLLVDGDMAPDEDMVILSVFGGYCYINASFVRMLGLRAPGGTVEVIDHQFFGESDAPAYQPRKGDKNLKSSMRLGKTVFRLLGTTELPTLEDDKVDVATYVDAYPGDDASDQELLDYFEAVGPIFQKLFHRHIDNTFSVALVLGALADLCAKIDRDDALVSLLGGIGDVESSAPAGAMWRLGRSAAEISSVDAAFSEGVGGLLQRLEAMPAAEEWLQEFNTFIDDFGSRGPNEWDIGSDPWAFRPELALAAIDRMRRAPEEHDPVVQAERLAASRAETVTAVRAALNPADRFQFDKALSATTVYSQGRERSKTTIIKLVHGARIAQRELHRRAAQRGGAPERVQSCVLGIDEFRQYVADPAPFAGIIAERMEKHAQLSELIPPFVVEAEVPDPSTWQRRDAAGQMVTAGTEMQGIAGCPGVARGRARVVLDPAEPGELAADEILVAPITDPSWTPLFLAASGVVVDVGATMSHAVIVSRELGIPCVVSAVGATTSIPNGATIEIDGSTGTVTVIELP